MLTSLKVEMEATLAPADLRLLRVAAEKAATMQARLFVVGGFARDLILGGRSADLDIVIEGEALRLGNLLAPRFGGRVISHPRFGTCTLILGEDSAEGRQHQFSQVDLISARSETYAAPGQLPHVHRGDIDDDLQRRDFSINAVAIRIDGGHFGEVHDPLGGVDDIQSRLIRVLHKSSFLDDPTRIFRAVRYSNRLGFSMEARTQSLARAAANSVQGLSAARVRHELDRILTDDRPGTAIGELRRLGALRFVHRALPSDLNVLARLNLDLASSFGEVLDRKRRSAETRWIHWLMDLTAQQIQSIDGRLHFDRRLRQSLLAAAQIRRKLNTLTRTKPSHAVAFLDEMPRGAIEAVWSGVPGGGGRQRLERYLTEWSAVKPRATAADLARLGIPAGPAYAEILRKLRARWLDGDFRRAQDERDFLLSYRPRGSRSTSRRRSGRGHR